VDECKPLELGFTTSKYRQLLRDLNSLMREHLFPTDLRYRLRQYLRFRHMQQEGVMILSPERKYLISILSPQLRTETMVHMNKTGMGSVLLFQQVEVPPEDLLALSLAARIEVGHECIMQVPAAEELENRSPVSAISSTTRWGRRFLS